MRFVILFVLICCGLLLQTSTLNYFSIGGVKPDLVLLLVVFNAFVRGNPEGARVGFFSGLLVDIIAGEYFGLNALCYMAAGHFSGMLHDKVYKNSFLIVMFIMWVTSMLVQILYYIILCYAGTVMPLGVVLTRVMIPTAVYTFLLVPLFYKKFLKSNQNGWLKGKGV